MVLSTKIPVAQFLVKAIIIILLFSGFITNFLPASFKGLSTAIIDFLFVAVLIHLLIHLIYGYFHTRRVDKTFFKIASIWLFLFFCTVLKLSFLDNNPIVERILGLRNNLIYAVLIIYIPFLIKIEKRLYVIYNLLLTIGLFLVVFSLLQFSLASKLPESLMVVRGESNFSFYGTSIIRPTALIGNTIIFASFTIILFSAYLAKYLYKPKRKDLFLIALIATANIFTFTRASLVGMVLVFIVTFFLRYGRFTVSFIRNIAIIFVTIIISALMLGYIYQDSFIIRRLTGQEASTQGSTNEHINQIIHSVKYLKQNYIAGAGVGSQGASGAMEDKIITDGYWFQLFLENGIVLGLFYFIFYSYCIIYAIRSFYSSDNIWIKQLCITFIASSAYFFFASFLNSAFAGRPNFIVYWLLFGLIISQNIIDKKSNGFSSN